MHAPRPLLQLQPGGVVSAGARVAEAVLFGLAPAALVAAFTLGTASHQPAFDFRALWRAGGDVLAGRSPYPSVEHLAGLAGANVLEFVYPPAAAVAAAPLALLPFGAAAAVFTVVLVAATVLALRLVGVEDWRCYGIALASPAVLDGIRLGTLTPLLALGVAAAWHWRSHAVRCGVIVAAVAVAKLYLAPLGLWLLLSRRYRAAAAALAASVALIAGGWALIGFAGLRQYPRLLQTLSSVQTGRSYSLADLARSLGGVNADALALEAAAAIALLGLLAWTHGRLREDGLLAAAVALALALSPILWLHYLMLTLIPLAVRRPRLSPAWALPLLLWLSPTPESGGRPLAILLVLLAGALALALPKLGAGGTLARRARQQHAAAGSHRPR